MEDTVWRVGCYKINPTTPSGQKFFILHMLVLPLIPITALVIQNSVTMHTLLGYQSRVSTIRRQVRGAMEIALFIQNIQEERAEVAQEQVGKTQTFINPQICRLIYRPSPVPEAKMA
jgi:hypothetical protein